MDSIAERLVFLRGNMTQSEFADRMGINVNTLRAYEKGRALPGFEVLQTLFVNLNVSAEWILTGRGPIQQAVSLPDVEKLPLPSEMREKPRQEALLTPMPPLSIQTLVPKEVDPPQNPHLQKDREISVITTEDAELMLIPMVEARLSAGHGSFEVSASSERSYAFRSDFLLRKGNPQKMVLMRVSGDSMEPEIKDNDVVLIDESKRDVTPGRLYAVGFGEAIYLKRIDVLPGKKVILKSVNPEYPNVELDTRGDDEETFRVIGRVLWCGREYK